jgi:hypothetical protein
MLQDHLAIVHDAPSARGACNVMARLARACRPPDRSADASIPQSREVSLFVTAQLALLNYYEESMLPTNRHHCMMTATRWVELSAEHSTDGIWAFDGGPVWIRCTPGEPGPLPVPDSLKEAIVLWNAEFEQQLAGTQTDAPLEEWGRAHDARGRELAKEIRRALPRGMSPWTVRFSPLFDEPEPVSTAPVPPRTDASPTQNIEGVLEDLDRRKEQETTWEHSRQADVQKWRFGIAPAEAPQLAGVYDMASMHQAMSEFRTILERWRSLVEKVNADPQHPVLPLQGDDVLAHWLCAQAQVVLSWTEGNFYALPQASRAMVPVNPVQASRYVKVMADCACQGLWSWQGYPIDTCDLQLHPGTVQRLKAWMLIYERAGLYDSAEHRKKPVDERMFDRLGLLVARAIARDLPDWQVDFHDLHGNEVRIQV